jgi:hypothetical protein
MASLINKHIADKMVGQPHGSGTFVRWEDRGKTTVMISKCGNPACGAERAVSLQNAAQAVKNPTIPVIACTMYCKTTITPTAKQSLEEVLAIPEYKRSSEQQRIVVDAEYAAKAAEAKRIKDAPLVAARARASVATNQEMFAQHERLLAAIHLALHGLPGGAYTPGGAFTTAETADVVGHPSYISFAVWKALTDEERAIVNAGVDQKLAAFRMSDFMRA